MHKLYRRDVVAILFSVICCSGFSAIMPYRMTMILILCCCLLFINLHHTKFSIRKSPLFFPFLMLFVYIATSVIYSYQKVETLKFLCVYSVGFLLIICPVTEYFYSKCLEYIEILCKIVAFSILIQLIIPNLYSTYLYFLIRGGASARQRLSGEVASHIYSGIVGEKGEAAFLMVIAVIIILSKCIRENKMSRNNLIWLIIYFMAMLLPAKRMLFAVGVLMLFLYIVFWTRGSRKLLAVGGAGILGVIGYIVVSLTPSLNTLLLRFTSFSDDDTANGRTYLWEYAINMFREKPLFGYGYGSYNTYASEKGVILTATGEWSSQAHNIFFQLLGEMGILGTLLFLCVCVISLYIFFRLYRKKNLLEKFDLALLFVGSCFLILTLVYGLTGNVIYYTNQIMFFFFGISSSVTLYKKYLKPANNFSHE